jgi:hypothetical protein
MVSYDFRRSVRSTGFSKLGPLTWTALAGISSEGVRTLAWAVEVDIVVG